MVSTQCYVIKIDVVILDAQICSDFQTKDSISF